MKTTMKKTAAYLLALLLVIQMVPAFADNIYSGVFTQGNVVYRDAIEITPGTDIDILKVGMENQLTVSSDYKNVSWESDHPEIATVDENGLVEALSAGKVTITVTSEGKYRDTISFKVIADQKTDKPQTEQTAQTEESGNAQGGEQDQNETIIIFIKGNKTKTDYNGQVQKNTYTVTTSNDALFEASKLKMKTDHLAEKKECGVWQDEMTEADFEYAGNAEIVVSNGWINIKPVQIEIKADDVTIEEGETPVFTASVGSGLIEGDTLDLSDIEFSTLESNGETRILPQVEEGSIIGNYKVKKVISGKLTVNAKQATGYDLYNMAEINGTWYRLRKTTIDADAPYTAYCTSTSGNKTVSSDHYTVQDYDFGYIVVNGVTYAYGAPSEDPEKPQSYYTADFVKIEVAYAKLGGAEKDGTPRWLEEDGHYGDPNNAGGYHRNFKITLHTMPEVQTLYNFLGVKKDAKGNVDTNYFRLKPSKIYAKLASSYSNSTVLKAEEYTLIPEGEYDFTGVVLTYNGKEYRYSPVDLEGEYESYFTVKFDRVFKKNTIHSNANWFNDTKGFLDGSEADFAGVTNNTSGFHRDYLATLHEGTATFYNIEMHNGDGAETIRKPENKTVELPVLTKDGTEFIGWNTAEDGSGTVYNAENPLTLTGDIVLYAQWAEQNPDEEGLSISITSSWPEGEAAYVGTKITLTAHPNGFENKDYTLQWQRSTDRQNWQDVAGETGMTMTFKLDEQTAQYFWRVVARNVKNK